MGLLSVHSEQLCSELLNLTMQRETVLAGMYLSHSVCRVLTGYINKRPWVRVPLSPHSFSASVTLDFLQLVIIRMKKHMCGVKIHYIKAK